MKEKNYNLVECELGKAMLKHTSNQDQLSNIKENDNVSRINVTVAGNVSKGVSKEVLQEQLAKLGIKGEIESIDIFEGSSFSDSNVVNDSNPPLEKIEKTKDSNGKNKKRWGKSFHWE
jgi:hypothetical protein